MSVIFVFFFKDPATTEIYTLSLHDALPISPSRPSRLGTSTRWAGSSTPRTPRCATTTRCRARSSTSRRPRPGRTEPWARSEEHTSELQSHVNLVCRLLLEKKKKNKKIYNSQ